MAHAEGFSIGLEVVGVGADADTLEAEDWIATLAVLVEDQA